MSKILFVNSNKAITDGCIELLDEAGHQLFCYDNYEEAKEFASIDRIDLAIIGLRGSDVEGLELFKQYILINPALAGILISDNANLDSLIEAMNCGFNKICRTPVDLKVLLQAVDSTLKITNLREEVTRMKTLLPLYKLGKCFLEARTEQAIYEQLVKVVCQEAGVPKVSVMMFDDKSETLKVVAFHGLDAKFVKNLEIKPGERIAGRVFTSQLPAILHNDIQYGPYVGLLKRKELAASISFPIASKGKVLGVLNVGETKGDSHFSEADIEMLSIISDQAMIALENIRSMQEWKEQNRIRTLMEQYVSPEVSKLLAHSGLEHMDKGTVQDLTVLFADIRNFTHLVQHLPPEQTRSFLNDFFENFATIVFSQNGMLDKFMGDAALAIFGAPVKLQNASEVAVKAAKAILDGFAEIRQEWCQKNSAFRKIGLGVGVSRGPIFLGNVGFTKRLDYTVIGTNVNVAQRLASKSKSGQLLITQSVKESLTGNHLIKAEMQMSLRGIEKELAVYSL